MYGRYDVYQTCPSGTQPYTIRAGDTFYALAIRFNTTVAAIMAANPNVDPNRLMIGQVVCIPGAPAPGHCPSGTQPYTIRAGDTFYALAIRFNTTVAAIMAANPNVDPNRLMIGQVICIPGAPVPGQCPSGTQPYTIQAGDTLFSLANRFNTTVAAIMAANPNIDPNRLMIGQVICIPGAPGPVPCPGGQLYTIRSGDTLYALSIRFNVTIAAIIAANPGLDPMNLRVGQIICIPAPPSGKCPSGSSEYTIRAGDTYFSLARRFNVSVQAIMDANPGVNPDALEIGQVICIPGA